MFVPATHSRRPVSPYNLELARVLLVHDDLAPRLTLQTLLQAGGYSVDVAASAAEAYSKLDDNQYELVLSDLEMEEPEAGRKLLAYARLKEYRPATALVTAWRQPDCCRQPNCEGEQQVSIDTEDLLSLLGQVADLIGLRASRRSDRALRQG
ncbi:MAG TPA: response regulator [Bryobacteraceae bacterium]|nr:response regulator [Bryobacteraceae bacterium]